MRSFFLSPTVSDDGLKIAAVSVASALSDKGLKVGFFQPIQQIVEEEGVVEYVNMLERLTTTISSNSFELSYVREKLRQNKSSDLMEELIATYEEFESKNLDIVLVEGVTPSKKLPQVDKLNASIANALNASTVFVASPLNDTFDEFQSRLEIQANLYGGIDAGNVLGVLLNGDENENVNMDSRFLCHIVGKIPNSTRIDNVLSYVDGEYLDQKARMKVEQRVSPSAFRHSLVKRASNAGKRIVLPEGDEPRTVQAAIICHEKNIAECVLIAKRSSVEAVANQLGLIIPDSIKIIEPTDEVVQQYVPGMVELRKSRGLTPEDAAKQLTDTVVLGTMMLAQDHVDGLVSGAIHTTANTIRPAFQLIKTHPDAGIASSVFFMLLPENVLVYGDCAINPNPTAEQLATIAIQSADSALAFGIEPRIAMISYSTGSSGMGDDVEKVKEATNIAKKKRPDLLIDGPLQYDAAYVESVAKKKAPDSPVAGRANVFIFPDLNTGNTTYKAVQRSAKVVSVGPMLQGLNKPVNDLSRGALVDDIVYTIALTAIQAV